MKKYIILYCLLSTLLLLVSCHNNRKEALLPELVLAEALIWDDPENALALLDTIKVPVKKRYSYATWCLLRTQAQDRNNIPFTSDSLIRIAVAWFEPRDDIHRKATAWFYAGQVYAGLRQTVEAAGFYIKAKEAALQTADPRLQYLICLNYGWLCLNQMALNEAKVLLNEAYAHAEESGVGKYRVTALDYIGRYYAFNAKMDTASLFLKQSVDLARQIVDPNTLIMALNDASIAFYRIEKYDTAISYLHESIGLKNVVDRTDFYPSFHNLGDLYRKLGEADSAVYYLNKALGTNDPYLLRSCYFSLAAVNSDVGQWKEAVHYTDLFWQYTDSIAQFTHHKEVAELHAQFEYQHLKNVNNQLEIEKSSITKGGAILFILLLGGILALAYILQQRLLRTERFRLSIQTRLQEQLRVYEANEQEISKNKEIVHSITTLLARRPELEKWQDTQESMLSLARNHNELLQQQNQRLTSEIADYLHTLKEKETEQPARDLLIEQNQQLQNNVQLFEEDLLLQMNLTGKLKTNPIYLTDELQCILLEEVNIVYPGFINRLRKQYPRLSAIEMLTCCLIKLQFTSSEIGTMTSAVGESVTRRKYRIKEKMQENQPDIWKKYASLDAYLWLF